MAAAASAPWPGSWPRPTRRPAPTSPPSSSSTSPSTPPGSQVADLLAALQGGYLLANTAHDVRPMEIAMDQALEHLKSYVLNPAANQVSRPSSEAGVLVSVVWPDDNREGS